MKEKNFKNIQLENEVIFENNNQKYTGRVIEVKKNTFTITCTIFFTNNFGIKSCRTQYLNFYKKSGKKASYRNTHGNALYFQKSFQQEINS